MTACPSRVPFFLLCVSRSPSPCCWVFRGHPKKVSSLLAFAFCQSSISGSHTVPALGTVVAGRGICGFIHCFSPPAASSQILRALWCPRGIAQAFQSGNDKLMVHFRPSLPPSSFIMGEWISSALPKSAGAASVPITCLSLYQFRRAQAVFGVVSGLLP